VTESTKYAPGELALLAFGEAWDAYCKQHGLAWPAPKIVVEDDMAVARFAEQRVSVAPWSPHARTDNVAEWMTEEALAHWTPIALTDDLSNELSVLVVASVLDRRIPW